MGKGIKLRHLIWLKIFKRKSGYLRGRLWGDRAMEIILSTLLIVFTIPVVLIIIPIILAIHGRPVFYAGNRYGWNKRLFIMYKFRTLPREFEAENHGTLVSYLQGYRLPWFSRFLRDTRLDEIPQLYNVLKGDMDLIGPRPVRPAVYEKACRKIRDYDKRFEVKPGLVGYSQLFTPHSAPKRIRSAIDNRATKYKKGMSEFLILVLAAFAASSACVQLLFRHALSISFKGRFFRNYNEKRGLDRKKITKGTVAFAHDEAFERGFSEEKILCGILYDMNEEYFRMDTNEKIDTTQTQFVITATIKKRFSILKSMPVKKSAYCHGEIFRCYENLNKDHKYSYIFRYRPVTDLNQYFVDQYFLKKGMMLYVF